MREVKNPTGGVINLVSTLPIYNYYFAADTSYKRFGKNYICATSIAFIEKDIAGKPVLTTDDQVAIFAGSSLIFLAKPKSKPERYGWKRASESLIRTEYIKSDNKYGMVVDSELSELQKINDKSIAILDDYTLPENIDLVYASSDAGGNHLLNLIMRVSDREAKKSLKKGIDMFQDKKDFVFNTQFWDLGVIPSAQ